MEKLTENQHTYKCKTIQLLEDNIRGNMWTY